MIILKKPIINEKSMGLTKLGLYTFEVNRNATKKQIEEVVKSKFSVDVVSVKTINVSGKKKMQRSRKGYYVSSDFKKAIVQLKANQKLAIFETVNEEQVEVKTGESVPVKEKKSLLRGTKVRIEKEKKEDEK